ncbi:glycosyltransferase family 2 protein [Patescibacteria group bacterium]|nr:glycosyltransferase family 2 protein [Patescibacteria group bacterium]
MNCGNSLRIPQNSIEPWISVKYVPDLVSVIIPTYNRGHIITETLDSVFEQTYRPIELIIVDDGSNDNTEQIVTNWTKKWQKDQFKVLYLHQANRGASAARNKGAKASKGEFIQFLDSDDLLLPSKLVKTIKAIGDNGVFFASVNLILFQDSPENVIGTCDLSERSHSPKSHLRSNALDTKSATYHRRALNIVGPWSEDLDILQDTEFCFRVLARTKGVWIPEALCRTRITEESISRRDETETCEAELNACRKIEKVAMELGLYNQELLENTGTILATISRNLAEKGHWDLSKKVFLEARWRMSLPNKIIHSVHRTCMYLIGCSTLKKLALK